MHARPCNLWVLAAGSGTCCTACRLYSIGATRNAMPPMQASRCNGSGCDYGNGLVSPGNPLTYDGRRLPSMSPWDCDERGASHTGVSPLAPDETPAPASPVTLGRRSPSILASRSKSTSTVTVKAEGDESVCILAIVAAQDIISNPNSSSSSVEITGTGNARPRRAGRFHPYSSLPQRKRKRQHQHQRAASAVPVSPA